MRSGRLHYGWIIALVSAAIMATCSLSVYTFGVFLEPLEEYLSTDRGPLSLAPSIAYMIAGFLAVGTGRLSDKYGPRILVTVGGLMMGAGFVLMSQVSHLRDTYVFWGLFMGVAFGCFISPLISTIPRWFAEKRGLAVSIQTTGFGIGAVVSPLLAQTLISAHGWQRAFVILGIISWALIIPLAQFIRKSPADMGQRPYGDPGNAESSADEAADEGLSLARAVKSSQFWVTGAIWFLWFFCLQAITVHIVPHATRSGIPKIAAASILSLIAGLSVVSRASMGAISDKLGARKALVLCLAVATLALVCLIFAGEIRAFYVFAIAFGLAYGGIIPLATLVPAELFGTRSLGVIIGALMLYSTIGGAGGSPFAGYVFDVTGSYQSALPALVGICLTATVLAVVQARQGVRKRPEH
ncbi:MAG: MFS transporter [Dehalococcoidia bacterium]